MFCHSSGSSAQTHSSFVQCGIKYLIPTHVRIHNICFPHVLVKMKVMCTLVQALRLCTGRTAHRWSRGIAVPFHDHGTRRGWGVSVTPRPLFTPGKTRYPLNRRLGGPQDRSGQVRKISPSTGIFLSAFILSSQGTLLLYLIYWWYNWALWLISRSLYCVGIRKRVSWCPISYCASVILRCLFGGSVTSCPVNVGFLGP